MGDRLHRRGDRRRVALVALVDGRIADRERALAVAQRGKAGGQVGGDTRAVGWLGRLRAGLLAQVVELVGIGDEVVELLLHVVGVGKRQRVLDVGLDVLPRLAGRGVVECAQSPVAALGRVRASHVVEPRLDEHLLAPARGGAAHDELVEVGAVATAVLEGVEDAGEARVGRSQVDVARQAVLGAIRAARVADEKRDMGALLVLAVLARRLALAELV